MESQTYLKVILFTLASTVLLVAGCAKESMDTFASVRTDNPSATEGYEICTDTTLFTTDYVLTAKDMEGTYVKTSELVCGEDGCAEAPFVSTLFIGLEPSLELTNNGTIAKASGPFTPFKFWTFNPAQASGMPNRLELSIGSNPDSTLQVFIAQVGNCRFRIINGAGWIEYTRLTEA